MRYSTQRPKARPSFAATSFEKSVHSAAQSRKAERKPCTVASIGRVVLRLLDLGLYIGQEGKLPIVGFKGAHLLAEQLVRAAPREKALLHDPLERAKFLKEEADRPKSAAMSAGTAP